MNTLNCLPQKSAKVFIAVILMLGAIGFAIIGVTVAPIIGFIAAIPFAAASIYFFNLHLNNQCHIE